MNQLHLSEVVASTAISRSGLHLPDRNESRVADSSITSVGDSAARVWFDSLSSEASASAPPASFGAIVGASTVMRRLFLLLERVAHSDINVLIEGESGTGKELVASEIVQRSARAEKPFVVVDCGAISPSLIESELFGHVRGAFTGADRDRMGAFESANGGTVLLDEIGELPLELQPKLLRALEAREIRRVGETQARRVDVRVLSATNRDLASEAKKGRFRQDLFFRLAVIRARVPPLRERLDDLFLLVRAFVRQLGVEDDEHLFSASVLSDMAKYHWPGNVRELRNFVARSVVLRTESSLHEEFGGLQPAAMSAASTAEALDATVPFRIAKDSVIASFERTYLSQLMAASGGNLSKAARMAGMDRMYLHRLVGKHGLRKAKECSAHAMGSPLGFFGDEAE